MKTMTALPALALILALTAVSAQAQCYADYKAKRDNPLRLHYGVVELPDNACSSRGAAQKAVTGKIGRDGWELLNVMSIFGNDGLAERKESAGAYYLRY